MRISLRQFRWISNKLWRHKNSFFKFLLYSFKNMDIIASFYNFDSKSCLCWLFLIIWSKKRLHNFSVTNADKIWLDYWFMWRIYGSFSLYFDNFTSLLFFLSSQQGYWCRLEMIRNKCCVHLSVENYWKIYCAMWDEEI